MNASKKKELKEKKRRHVNLPFKHNFIAGLLAYQPPSTKLLPLCASYTDMLVLPRSVGEQPTPMSQSPSVKCV